jgi:hypothetical protein
VRSNHARCSFGGSAGTTQTPDLATLIERDRVASDAFDAKDIKPMRGSSDRVMMLGGEPASSQPASSCVELTRTALASISAVLGALVIHRAHVLLPLCPGRAAHHSNRQRRLGQIAGKDVCRTRLPGLGLFPWLTPPTRRSARETWIKRWATEKRKRQAMGLKMVDYRSIDYVSPTPTPCTHKGDR